MKVYLYVVLLALLIAFGFGVAIPYLISQPSTELFLIGVFVIIISFPIVYYIARTIFREISKKHLAQNE